MGFCFSKAPIEGVGLNVPHGGCGVDETARGPLHVAHVASPRVSLGLNTGVLHAESTTHTIRSSRGQRLSTCSLLESGAR